MSLRERVAGEAWSGALLLGAAIVAVVWANSPARELYVDLVQWRVGPEFLGLRLSLRAWGSEALLAIFFFAVGLELAHETRAGSLSRPREAAVPVLAAVGGMVVPAVIYVAVVRAAGAGDALTGWPVPTATDIAFALAVLAVCGRGLDPAVRIFLLTLAVVDDLLAITVIAVFYTAELRVEMLLAALVCVAVFRFTVTRTWARWWVLVPVAVAAWWLMHESGVHATVAGVLLGICVPARPLPGEARARTRRYEDVMEPLSAGIVLPLFAFLAAGVTVVGVGVGEVFGSPIAIGVIAGLVLGKAAGVLLMTALLTRLTPLRLAAGLQVRDLLGVGFLTGIGFTVALLMAELSFVDGVDLASAKAAVLLGSIVAASAGALTLRSRRVSKKGQAPSA